MRRREAEDIIDTLEGTFLTPGRDIINSLERTLLILGRDMFNSGK